jgi:hypothetical protein
MPDQANSATVAASEDMDCLFVLADQYAPDRDAAIAALVELAASQWHYVVDRSKLPTPFRLWYKQTSDVLVPCTAHDPEAESQWWVFNNLPADALDLADVA